MAELGLASDFRLQPPRMGSAGAMLVVHGSLRHGSFRISFSVRRSRYGTISISFPCRQGHPLAWPVNGRARRLVEDEIIAELRRRGWIS